MNYESYLIFMMALVLILTDENAEIRFFIISQKLANLLTKQSLTMETESIKGFQISDTNDFVAL